MHDYRSLIHDLCRKTQIDCGLDEKCSVPLPRLQWTEEEETAFDLLDALIGIIGDEHKFDAIIVDDAQYFLRGGWWDFLNCLFRDELDKVLFVFHSPKPNAFSDNIFPSSELGNPFRLPENCRNTREIVKHCSNLIGIEPLTWKEAIDGDEPEVLKSGNFKSAFELAAKQVDEWCQVLTPSHVVVLAPDSQKEHCVEKSGTVPMTTKYEDWQDEKGVLLSSAERFHGLEAFAVVILWVPSEDPDELMEQYFARSRATNHLLVIEVDERTQ